MENYFIPIYRDANGVIHRSQEPAPAIGRGIIDPDSVLRTNAKLLSIINGKTQGSIPRLNTNDYDYGDPLQTDAAGRPESTEGRFPHVYGVNPASVGEFSEHIAAYSRAASDSTEDDRSDVQAEALPETAESSPNGGNSTEN